MPGRSHGSRSGSSQEETKMQMAFRELADDSGRITSARLREYVAGLGLDFSDDEIREMLEIADPAGQGSVSLKGICFLLKIVSTFFKDQMVWQRRQVL